MEDLRLQKIAYSCHKSKAKHRGIEFKLTFDEWWDIWKPHYHNRGSKVGQFCMCRTMDKGAYEVGNVRIDTVQGNANTRKIVNFDKKIKEVQKSWVGFQKETREDDEDGWLPREFKNPFRSSLA